MASDELDHDMDHEHEGHIMMEEAESFREIIRVQMWTHIQNKECPVMLKIRPTIV